MNPRLTLGLAFVALIGGAIYLWLGPAETPSPLPNPPAQTERSQPAPRTTASPDTYMLAASWQPGFCETQPNKRECRTQTERRFDAKRFALHGLWPQPRGREYCVGVTEEMRRNDRPATWQDLPEVKLAPATRAELDKVMPGTASALDRHEWLVHGTCSNFDMETYFSHSLALMSELNASPLADFMASHIDKTVTPAEIRAAADKAFGKGAGTRISVECKTEQDGSRKVLTELQIALDGALGTDTLSELILAARPQDANSGQCPRVVIDRAGL